jgi:hypothetical protein
MLCKLGAVIVGRESWQTRNLKSVSEKVLVEEERVILPVSKRV